MKNYVLYFVGPHQIAVEEEPVPVPKKNEVLVENNISGISAGTEMLFYRGLVPTDMLLDETIPTLNHSINYPFKYGYCSVGQVIDVGSEAFNYLLNRRVFVFNTHESYFCVNEEQLILLPDNLSPDNAIFIPNMETAINLLLDGAPLIGENVLVLGLGIVGILTTALLQQFPLSVLFGIDLYQKRRETCLELGAKYTFDAAQVDLAIQLNRSLNELKHTEIDLIYELTGNPEALNTAIASAGFEARIVLGSWYGTKPCHIDLGGKFHRNRIQVIASQVSTLASKLKGRWTKDRRLDATFHMLEAIRPARLISHNFHITQAAQAYQLLESNPADALQITLTYEQ